MEAISKLNFTECSHLMEILEVSCEEIEDLTQARSKLVEELKKSQENAGWSPGEAFSAFAEARDKDVSKRRKLLEIYGKVEETIVGKCEERLLEILQKYFGYDVKIEIAKKRQELTVEEYIVLFAGETSSGKSSLINLIMGEEFLPYAALPVTSTICEVRYGSEKKIKIHHKDGAKEIEEINLLDQKDGQSYVEQLMSYLRKETDRDQGSEYAKIEIFWTHDLLKDGLVIVDSPGIGEYPEMDQFVIDYLTKAFAFVYVINVSNGGGIQEDRLVKLFRHVREKSPDNYLAENAVFVCNKWDQIDRTERKKMEEHIVKKLEKCWPRVDSEVQVVKMTTTDAARLQNCGIITEQFTQLIVAVKSMMLRTMIARLEEDCRWLDSILSRIHFHTTILIRNEQSDDPLRNMLAAKLQLEHVKLEYDKSIKKLERKLEEKTKEVVHQFYNVVNQTAFVEKFTNWSGKRYEDLGEFSEEMETVTELIICEQFEKEIEEWEAENHVIEEAHKSLMKRLKKYSDSLEFKIKAIEEDLMRKKESNGFHFTTAQKVLIGVTSPVWIPFALAIALPILAGKAMRNFVRKKTAKKLFAESRDEYMKMKSKEFLKKVVNEEYISSIITEKFNEIKINIDEMKSNFSKLIDADMHIILAVLGEGLRLIEAAEYYSEIHSQCPKVRGELSIFTIEEVVPRRIEIQDLTWEGEPIGRGSFADVYEGYLQESKEEKVEVAVKICNDSLTEKNAHQILSEELILRKLDHKNVVKFYGGVLQPVCAGTKFIFVMERCAENLGEYFEKHQDLSPARAPKSSQKVVVLKILNWTHDIASGLAYLNDEGIVHRDLKPENILIGSHNTTLKIADVGIAKDEKEVTGTWAGTPVYMAPEIFSQSKIYGAPVDIYSLGLIMWELWYGERVFTEVTSIKELIKNVENGHRPGHVEDCEPVLFQFGTLMQKCWQTEPDKRPKASHCVKTISDIINFWKQDPHTIESDINV